MEIVNWIIANWKDILDGVAYIVLGASVIVKLTPTLRDDSFFLPIIKFIGKYVALDKFPRPQDIVLKK